ncbi:MAG: ATP-binding protein [Acidimicrobiales bacterium]
MLTQTWTIALAAVSVICAGVAALVAISAARRRARIARRIDELADRLDAPVAIMPGAEGSVQRLGTAIDQSAFVAARRVETLLGQALDSIPQGVVLYAPDGKQTVCNRAATAFLDVRHGGPELDQVMWDLLTPGFAGEPGTQVVDVEGPTHRTYLLTALPLRSDDGTGSASARVDGVAVVMDDISERRRVDDLRRDFVSNISHELKTPLGAMGLLAETLIAETAPGEPGANFDATSPEVVQRLAARLHHEALRIGRTIDDLLELSKIEVGEPSSRDPVPVTEILADAVERAGAAAALRDVSLDVACDPPQLILRGDRRQLVSAIANLLDNAIKYSDPGSSVEALGSSVDGCVELSVIDHGIGIPQRHLDRVFERFYRVDSARSRTTGGTGLGLAIVRHVVNNHDGEVRVESVAGDGSTFTLRIPLIGAGEESA